jgi:hypothetical protein
LLNPQTAARKLVLARWTSINGNEILKEMAHEETLATNLSSLSGSPLNSIDFLPQTDNHKTLSPTAWPTGLAPSTSGLASTSGTYSAQPPWGGLYIGFHACRPTSWLTTRRGLDVTEKDGKNPDQQHFIT